MDTLSRGKCRNLSSPEGMLFNDMLSYCTLHKKGKHEEPHFACLSKTFMNQGANWRYVNTISWWRGHIQICSPSFGSVWPYSQALPEVWCPGLPLYRTAGPSYGCGSARQGGVRAPGLADTAPTFEPKAVPAEVRRSSSSWRWPGTDEVRLFKSEFNRLSSSNEPWMNTFFITFLFSQQVSVPSNVTPRISTRLTLWTSLIILRKTNIFKSWSAGLYDHFYKITTIILKRWMAKESDRISVN